MTPPHGAPASTTTTDIKGRTTKLTQHLASDSTTTYTYTPASYLASMTDPKGNKWSYTYDVQGNQLTATDPDKGTSTKTYNALDLPATVKSGYPPQLRRQRHETLQAGVHGTPERSILSVTRPHGEPHAYPRYSPTMRCRSADRDQHGVSELLNSSLSKTVRVAAVALPLIAVALLGWAWLGGDPAGLIAVLAVSLLVGIAGLIISEGWQRVLISILLTLVIGLAMATAITVGARSMKACESEEGFLVGYTISRSYNLLNSSIICIRVSETGQVKSSEISVWSLLSRP